MLDSLNFVSSDPVHTVQSRCKVVSSHQNVLTLESMADVIVLYKQLKRPGAHGYLFRSALQFGEWSNIISRTRQEDDSDSSVGEGTAIKMS